MKTIAYFILFILALNNPVSTNAQNLVYKRLQNVENKHPEKLEKLAKRYTKIFPEKPDAYFFLSKHHMHLFENQTEEKKRSKSIKQSIKYATKAQKLAKNTDFLDKDEWISQRVNIKYEAYFFMQKLSLDNKDNYLKKKYYRFISYNEFDFLSDKRLALNYPEELKVDSLFYGMPTGKEQVKIEFLNREKRLLNLINEERANRGLSQMVLDSSLSAACRYHAYDMGTQNYMGHTGYDFTPNGDRYFANATFDRIKQFYSKSKVITENISCGGYGAQAPYNGWYNSPGHNRNMFNPDNRLVGIGLVYVPDSEYGYYWVFTSAK